MAPDEHSITQKREMAPTEEFSSIFFGQNSYSECDFCKKYKKFGVSVTWDAYTKYQRIPQMQYKYMRPYEISTSSE